MSKKSDDSDANIYELLLEASEKEKEDGARAVLNVWSLALVLFRF